MFCPSCGLEDKQSNQFCRACGGDLRPVRNALAKPDNITSSAVAARDEIGRAIAAKIREMDSARDLKKFAEDVLPNIEKFLESPAEKRLRRMRAGTIVASIGLGVTLAFKIMAILLNDNGIFFLAGLGMITFFIGLSFIINALFFSVPRKSLPDNSLSAASQRELDTAETHTNDLVMPETNNDIFSSVTEHTTHQLKEKQPIPRS
ncbi:MAG: zinc ribbon domain-containing protein [Acidobacteriota bacterium]|nr:zinc ribbon domain-containing protein [Acidobacteriota bacterium]